MFLTQKFYDQTNLSAALFSHYNKILATGLGYKINRQGGEGDRRQHATQFSTTYLKHGPLALHAGALY